MSLALYIVARRAFVYFGSKNQLLMPPDIDFATQLPHTKLAYLLTFSFHTFLLDLATTKLLRQKYVIFR